jgi:hypothetical protein
METVLLVGLVVVELIQTEQVGLEPLIKVMPGVINLAMSFLNMEPVGVVALVRSVQMEPAVVVETAATALRQLSRGHQLPEAAVEVVHRVAEVALRQEVLVGEVILETEQPEETEAPEV